MNIYTFSIIFLNIVIKISSSEDSSLIDLSHDCRNNLKANFFLTNGMGFADGLAIYLKSSEKNCTINLYTDENEKTIVQILVVEAIDVNNVTQFCKSNNITIFGGIQPINVCSKTNKQFGNVIFVGLFNKYKTSVQIHGNASGIKLTATSAKLNENGEECDKEREIFCKIRNVNLCVDSELKCDNNINCGRRHKFDEEITVCDKGEYRKFCIIITCGIVLFLISLIIIIKLCYDFVPRIPKHFFKTTLKEDNKLILGRPHTNLSKLTLKTVNIQTPSQAEKKKSSVKKRNASIGNESIITEEEIRSQFYKGGKSYKSPGQKKKRLTTNSPIGGYFRRYHVHEDDDDAYDNKFLHQWHHRRRRNDSVIFWSKNRRYSSPEFL